MGDLFDTVNPRPLKVGIRQELIVRYADVFSAREITTFLIFWTRRHEYLTALAVGRERIGMDGTREPLTAEHAQFAARQMIWDSFNVARTALTVIALGAASEAEMRNMAKDALIKM